MTRSIVISVVCLAVIAASIVYTARRPKSKAQVETEKAGWRMCHECGHEWHMELAEIAAQSKANPEHTGFVQCPNCEAWRGMPRVFCPKCHKAFTAYMFFEQGGILRVGRQDTCPHCGFVLGSEVLSQEEEGGATEDDDAPE